MNLEHLKVGDKVVLCSGGIMNYRRVTTIDKDTPKQFVVGGSRFWKKNGYGVGSRRQYLRPVTEQDLEADGK